jgi:uncharacterized protein (DUF4415 family)
MIPEIISEKSLKQLQKLETLSDEYIDYSDIPPLSNKQLEEIVRIVKERKEHMPSITLKLPEKILNKYKEFGTGYTKIMSYILCEYMRKHNNV